jgi:hypothetical protein
VKRSTRRLFLRSGAGGALHGQADASSSSWFTRRNGILILVVIVGSLIFGFVFAQGMTQYSRLPCSGDFPGCNTQNQTLITTVTFTTGSLSGCTISRGIVSCTASILNTNTVSSQTSQIIGWAFALVALAIVARHGLRFL